MKAVSLVLNYARQSSYWKILLDMGIVSNKEKPSTENINVLFSAEEFVHFTHRALKESDRPFSLRSMDFHARELDEKELAPVQGDLFKNGGVAIEQVLSDLFGMPVVMVENFDQLDKTLSKALKEDDTPCQCPGCMARSSLAEALGINLRETQMAVNQEPKAPTDEELLAEREKAEEWNKKLDYATDQALKHFYTRQQGVSSWAMWRYLEQHQGRVAWNEFRPSNSLKDLSLAQIWVLAQRLRQSILEMMP